MSNRNQREETVMSTMMSVSVAPADAAASPPRATSVARVAALAVPAAEARPPKPVGAEPEVYCQRLGASYAAQGYAPCSDLGCGGCTPDRR
jgi:hypothetical protein